VVVENNIDIGPRLKSLRGAPPLHGEFRRTGTERNQISPISVLYWMLYIVHGAHSDPVDFASLHDPTLSMRAAIKGGPALTLQHVSPKPGSLSNPTKLGPARQRRLPDVQNSSDVLSSCSNRRSCTRIALPSARHVVSCRPFRRLFLRWNRNRNRTQNRNRTRTVPVSGC
jgi:hypothetical protein